MSETLTEAKKPKTEAPRVRYGEVLAELGPADEDIVVLDADLSGSTKTNLFGKACPERFFQMGIAEGNMINTAAGFAAAGKKPFVSTFAIFAARGWEQIRNTIARANLPVRIVLTHGGISVGEDGASAQANEDIAMMRVLPRMTVVVPADVTETEQVITFLMDYTEGPIYVRLPRTKVKEVCPTGYRFELGKASLIRDGSDGTIIACGQMVSRAVAAADILKKKDLSIRVLNMSTIKPLDEEAVIRAARETGRIVTAEEHSVIGGLGSAVSEVVVRNHPVPMDMVGVKDTFGESGTTAELLEKYGLTAEKIAEKMTSLKTG